MRHRSTGFALALLALTGFAGCKKPCDDEAVNEAAKAFEQRTVEGRRQGLSALEQACPSMPPQLLHGLGVAYAGADDESATHLDASPKDETLAKLVEQTCPRSEQERTRARDHNDHAAVTRETCRFDRYGVLDSDEIFVRRDFGAFVLYEWLTTNQVDPSPARRIARSLMAVTAGPEELQRLCYAEDDACEFAFQNAGIAPPHSTSDVPILDTSSTELRISLTEIAIDGEHVVPLTTGRSAPGAFEQRISIPLQEALVHQAAQETQSAEAKGEAFAARLRLLADASVPFGTIADAMFSATKAGYREFAFVVSRSHGRVATLMVSPPSAWFDASAEPNREAKPMQLRLVVHRSGVELTTGAVDETPDTGPLAPRVDELKQLFPHETVAMFRVDRDVPLQRLISVIDTVRGEDCTLLSAMTGNEIPAQCLLWQPIVDIEE